MSRHTVSPRTLREHPDLDQLKRQAKELLSAFRAGQSDAVAEVGLHYHGADVASFALHDAQLVLARAYGFPSWPKLKAFVDGATVSRLFDAVRSGDTSTVKGMLEARPEIVNMDASGGDDHRALHHAVLTRNASMVRLLLAHGANPRIGIYPHRVPTTALAIATERNYDDIVGAIRDAEERPSGSRGSPRPSVARDVPRELSDAIERADADAVIRFLESNPILGSDPAAINSLGPEGLTLLHVAAARLMLRLATWLLDHGADPNVRSTHGLTPIDMLGRWPVTHPQDALQDVTELLLQHGAERTAFWAVATGNLDWLRARHRQGTLENHVNDAGGLVTYAVRVDRPEALTLLLDLGFDPDERSNHSAPGGKPLEYCARLQRLEMADMLLARGATLTGSLAVALGNADWIRARHGEGRLTDPSDGPGLLSIAVELDRADILRLLLELGFSPDERKRVAGGDGVQESRGIPLERCAGKGKIAMAEILLAHGADPNAQNDGGCSPMSTAYRARDRRMLDLLARHGGHVSAATAAYHRDVALARQRIEEEDAGRLPPGGVTPGRTVAEDLVDGDCGEPEIIRMALARIDWTPDDPRWYSALRGPLSFWNHVPWIESADWAFDRRTYLPCFRLILARCHANVRGSLGRTILHDVIVMGHHDGVSGWVTEDEALAFTVTLLDAGAHTDVRDELLQSTPLWWACRWGRTKIVKELLARGVDPVEPDAQPWATPLAWARKMGHGEIVRLLEARG